MYKKQRKLFTSLLFTTCAFMSACSTTQINEASDVLGILEQGSFAVGGTVITAHGAFNPLKPMSPDGQTFHGDHAYVSYQIPANARKFPLVFLHGWGQSSRTWETTPDGREGFQSLFLRRGFGVYLVDQPGRGKAGRGTQPADIKPVPDEQLWFSTFRIGRWPEFYPGVQFPRDADSLNQFFRQMTPHTSPHDNSLVANALVALFDRVGDGVLVTHSAGGGPGWHTVMKSTQVKAVVSYEPGLFIFPDGEVPEPIPGASPFDPLKAAGVPMAEFIKLTKIPIVLYFGDNIPEKPSQDPGKDNWRTRLQMAKFWAESMKKYGGDVTLVVLPEIGITGNTHFMFSDLNNIEIADLLSNWLREKGLD
jgi:pimeloyl-ACP methyl ester carboxylesterase